ncbi:MAG: peptide chain release factor N(5)-glutamine methyltransferase [Gammaproteobacteria bacterium]|nr:peptide chain release factor N(5)-glutamine methyltransferase [Gammaproteobacteria bacterium]
MNDSRLAPHSLAELLASARAQLDDPREAALLVGHALGLSREMLYAHPERTLSPEECEQALALVARRADGQPVAYLTGQREFYGLALQVGPAVLIPRPETELVVELALERMKGIASPAVADLGTGSGAIALAIAHERADARVTATDRSPEALVVAANNARQLDIANVKFVQSDWLESLEHERFDVIVSNPPYVAVGDPHLEQGDLRFEPSAALSSGPDGLDDIRRIALEAKRYLKPNGNLILEHGADQQADVSALLAEQGYTDITGHRDLAHLPRAVSCKSQRQVA